MNDTDGSQPKLAIAALIALLLCALLLAACGSSGSAQTGGGSTTTSASVTTNTTAGGTGGTGAPTGQGNARFLALQQCLQKNGIVLPKRKPGQGGPGAGGGLLNPGGLQLPKGVSRTQLQAALRKCGGGLRGRRPLLGSRLSSPAFKAALTKFAGCLRENGVNIGAPNLSGNGPIFGTKGLTTNSPRFRAAEMKCRPLLRSALGAPAGSAPGG